MGRRPLAGNPCWFPGCVVCVGALERNPFEQRRSCHPARLIVHLIYACGLRVCEPLNLRIKDFGSQPDRQPAAGI